MLKDGHEWDLQNIIWADELGFEEFSIGEHHAMVWEPHPSRDLLVVEGFRQTKNIRIGRWLCLPYRRPASWPTGSPCWITSLAVVSTSGSPRRFAHRLGDVRGRRPARRAP